MKKRPPDEIMEYLRDHLVEIRRAPSKVAPIDSKRRIMDEWARE